FEERKEEFKLVMEKIALGDELYAQGTRDGYTKALDYYLEAQKFNPHNDQLNYKIGDCYLNSDEKAKSIEYFKMAFQLNKEVNEEIHYKLGRAYHLNMQLENALQEYKLSIVREGESKSDFEERRLEFRKRIREVETAMKLVETPVRVFIDNMGPNINSSAPDYSPLIMADASMMIFTSRRQNDHAPDKNGMFDEEVYVSYFKDGKWQKANRLPSPINTENHDASVGFSNDGQKMILFQAGDLYFSELKGDAWTAPVPLPEQINSKEQESSACFSYDGNTIYFVSDRKDGIGGRDIYCCTQDKNGIWGDVKKVPRPISSTFNDQSVFMHPDGKTLYFSSNGEGSIGGYDIFKSVLGYDLKWKYPVNMGYPINTPDDDFAFVMSASGKYGYYSSVKDGGYGAADIYMITFRGPEKNPVRSNQDNLIACEAKPINEQIIEEELELEMVRLTLLKGIITDVITGRPVEADIEIVDNVKNEVVYVVKSNSSTGKYLVSLPSGKNYGIAVRAPEYLFLSENFDIPETQNYREITKDFVMSKVDVGSKIILNNIFFETGKATLKNESFAELERFLKLLNAYKTITVEISGHTDNTGGDDINNKLSNDRAKAVVDYLAQKGIDSGRLKYKGYGSSQPVAPNTTEEGRRQNRRVEFKVLSK
ncbi:MAG: OmpA family protein, partial [Bacteroidota bacterium]